MAVMAPLARYGGKEAEKTYPELLNRCQRPYPEILLFWRFWKRKKFNKVCVCLHVHTSVASTSTMMIY